MRKKQKHRIWAAIFLLILVTLGVSGYRYESERTPEYAMEALMTGLAHQDAEAVTRYARVDALAAAAYDESTAILARDIELLQAEYPQDWFFRHDTAFMEQYIAGRRTQDLQLMQRAWALFLQPAAIPAEMAEQDDAAWCAREAKEIVPHYRAKLQAVTPVAAGRAVALLDITGDDTAYGQLVPHLSLRLELEQQEDGHYQVVRLANVAENFAPVVKGIEDYCTMKGIQ